MMQGILIVDKPTDWTSFDVIAKLRGILGTRKLGHSGTLDPMATGVLPVFCGGASKAVDLQLDHTKAYRAVLRLGQRTDTGDVTGTVLETAPVTAGEQELLAVLPQFLGPRMQTPPMYSAVKINGQPLYKLAREGKTVERKARPIEILDIRYEGSPAENEYALTVKCSKGTYIRVLLEEIAEAMGQKGTMSALRRVAAGVYSEADAHTLEEIQAAKDDSSTTATPSPRCLIIEIPPCACSPAPYRCRPRRYPSRMAAPARPGSLASPMIRTSTPAAVNSSARAVLETRPMASTTVSAGISSLWAPETMTE